MITEDYVSFEVAKLLKEKGFNEATNRYYNAQYDSIRTVSDTFMTYWNNEEHMKVLMMEGAIAIPTLQMASKWLREVHKIHIDVIIEGINSCIEYKAYARPFKIIYPVRSYDSIDTIKIGRYNSYEKAIETALKYVLENLI